MAYDHKKLVGTSAHIAPEAPVHYDYNITDSDEDITTAGYFPAESGIKAGDIITQNLFALTDSKITGVTRSVFVATVEDGVITLAAETIPEP